MDIKKPQLVKVGAFAYFFEGVLQHPLVYLEAALKSAETKTEKVSVALSSL